MFGLCGFPMNTLYYHDNLNILRDFLSEPGAVATGFRVRDREKNPVITIPGSHKTNYNILFKDESGVEADSLERHSKTRGIETHWPSGHITD